MTIHEIARRRAYIPNGNKRGVNMPIPSLGGITGDDLQSLIDSLEKQRKE